MSPSPFSFPLSPAVVQFFLFLICGHVLICCAKCCMLYAALKLLVV